MSESRDGDTEEHVGASGELKVELGCERTTPGNPGQIKIERFRTPHRLILKKYDNDNDGRINANEIQEVVTALMTEQFRSKAFRIGLIILTFFTVVLLGALFGLTWAVVAALKDTQVSGDVLVTNDKSETPVMMASLELTIDSGRLISRSSSSVITTSTLQTRGAVSVTTPMSELLTMKALVFSKDDGSSYSFAIEGVGRVLKNPASANSTFVLKFQTDSGLLTLDEGVWSATDVRGPMEDLFSLTDGRRRLQSSPSNTYVICDAGECGDPIPCGLPGYDACPPSPPTVKPPPPPPPSTLAQQASGLGQTCSSSTGAVYSCMDGVYRCYGAAPNPASKARFLNQTGCTPTTCGTWFYDGQSCASWYTTTAYQKTFCCP